MVIQLGFKFSSMQVKLVKIKQYKHSELKLYKKMRIIALNMLSFVKTSHTKKLI